MLARGTEILTDGQDVHVLRAQVRIVTSSSSHSSPSPQMIPDLVSMPGSICLARRSSSSARDTGPPGRASR